MAKILALDLGDQWIGSAISDATRIIAKPYKTVAAAELISFLHNTINTESISLIIIGNPITMKGTESQQTVKIKKVKEELEKQFPHISFILWDERLSSKRADELKKAKNKEEKIAAHSRAAAFILQSYLDFLSQQ